MKRDKMIDKGMTTSQGRYRALVTHGWLLVVLYQGQHPLRSQPYSPVKGANE